MTHNWRIEWIEPAGYWQAEDQDNPSLRLTAWTREQLLENIEIIEKRKEQKK